MMHGTLASPACHICIEVVCACIAQDLNVCNTSSHPESCPNGNSKFNNFSDL